MNHLNQYILQLNFMLPFFTGVSCMLLMLLSYGDSLTRTEAEIKRVAIVYFLSVAFSWLATFIYGYFPEVFLLLNIPTYLAYLYSQILFYRLFHILTRLNESERFSPWHYVAPLLISGTLLIWSLLVPYGIQLEIVQGRGVVIPEGYEAFTRFFSSKPPMRLLFSLIYITLTIRRLIRYYQRVNESPTLVRRPAGWVMFLAVLMVTLLISSGLGTFISRRIVYTTMLIGVSALAISAQHIVLTYHILRRHYMLFITFPGREHVPLKEMSSGTPERERKTTTVKSQRKNYTRTRTQLTRKSFEAHIHKCKPYLDPEFKITDLMQTMNINRTYLSNFVNQTYGVNFNRYINRCRLEELKRLVKLPSNTGKKVRDLVEKAGFSDYKHYTRVWRAENEAAGKDTTPNKKEK